MYNGNYYCIIHGIVQNGIFTTRESMQWCDVLLRLQLKTCVCVCVQATSMLYAYQDMLGHQLHGGRVQGQS